MVVWQDVSPASWTVLAMPGGQGWTPIFSSTPSSAPNLCQRVECHVAYVVVAVAEEASQDVDGHHAQAADRLNAWCIGECAGEGRGAHVMLWGMHWGLCWGMLGGKVIVSGRPSSRASGVGNMPKVAGQQLLEYGAI